MGHVQRERPQGSTHQNRLVPEPHQKILKSQNRTAPAPEKPKNIAPGRSSIWSQGQGERYTQSYTKLDGPRFEKLANIYGRNPDDEEDSEYEFPDNIRSCMFLKIPIQFPSCPGLWEIMPSMLEPRASPSVAAVDNRIYVFGGDQISEVSFISSLF